MALSYLITTTATHLVRLYDGLEAEGAAIPQRELAVLRARQAAAPLGRPGHRVDGRLHLLIDGHKDMTLSD